MQGGRFIDLLSLALSYLPGLNIFGMPSLHFHFLFSSVIMITVYNQLHNLIPVSVVVLTSWTGLDGPALLLATMLQLYLTPGKRLGNTVVFTVGPVRISEEGMFAGSIGWQDKLYPVKIPLRTAGSCHEKLRLVAVTDVIWNIRGRPGATKGEC